MKQETILSIAGLGEVRFVASVRAKRMNISLRPDGLIRVAVPRGVPFSQALAFTKGAGQWLEKQRIKQQARRKRLACEKYPLPANEELSVAAEQLRTRCFELARANGFQPQKVAVRCQKSRWGSCSSRGNISLNVNLAFLPEELRDYVIWHELIHLREPNHGPRFWQELERYQPDARLLARRLREYPMLVTGRDSERVE